MFVSRRAHEALIAEKDKLIRALDWAHSQEVASLKSEIEFLRHLVQPRTNSASRQIEADAVLEGRDTQIPLDDKKAAIDSEAARLLSGNY